MPLQLVTPPVDEPVTLAEAKLHLRVDFDEDDALILALISAARQAAEAITAVHHCPLENGPGSLCRARGHGQFL